MPNNNGHGPSSHDIAELLVTLQLINGNLIAITAELYDQRLVMGLILGTLQVRNTELIRTNANMQKWLPRP